MPPTFDGAVYERGAMALQALRHRVGDDAFWRLAAHAGWPTDAAATAATAEFEALAEEVSGQDLGRFFDAWLRTLAKPAATADQRARLTMTTQTTGVTWFRPPIDGHPGLLNACYNALDIHVVRGRADDVAAHLDGTARTFAPAAHRGGRVRRGAARLRRRRR